MDDHLTMKKDAGIYMTFDKGLCWLGGAPHAKRGKHVKHLSRLGIVNECRA